MMSREEHILDDDLQRAIQAVALEKGNTLAQAITPVIFTNLDRGRIHHFLEVQGNDDVAAYVWRVAGCYEEWHHYLYQLQIEQCAEVWEPLYEKWQRWAYHYLLRRGFGQSGSDRFEHAVECATTAAIQLLHARFPYDVAFDPWASVLLQNVVNKHVANEKKGLDKLIDLARVERGQEALPVSTMLEEADLAELRQDLLKAIEQLASEARKQVIWLHYFDSYTFPQIAEMLGKSENAIYKLHYDALNDLRKIWGDLRNKYE
jgi:RNA polymerase sigma factor (sigma-70 family)